MAKKERHTERPIVRLSAWFFHNWRYTFLLWITILIAGLVTYVKLIPREGFPSVQFPLTVISGTYFVDDPSRVDREVTQPVSEAIKQIPEITTSQSNAGGNFFSVVTQFNDSVDPKKGTEILKAKLDSIGLPTQAQFNYTTVDPAAFLNKYDLLLSVYATNQEYSAQELQAKANEIIALLKQNPSIADATLEPIVSSGVNPATNVQESRQTGYNRIGLNENGSVQFYPSITIGLDRDASKFDALEFSDIVRSQVDRLNATSQDTRFKVAIAADFAESINTQIRSLQTNLRDGLIAVAIVSFLLITWRASLIIGIFMISVMAVVIGVLYAIGYSLNTITLFALVLSLGLIVDDATIVVEALDVHRSRKKHASDIVRLAIRRVGTASVAGTFSTILVFLPMAFVQGVLGDFIRLMPVTIILSLLASLALSLTMIPLLSKFLLLPAGESSRLDKLNPVSKLEATVGHFVGSLPARLRSSHKRNGRGIAVGMIVLSLVFIGLAGYYAQKLTFNIFPPSKDSNQIGLQITYPQGYTLPKAERIADQLNDIIRKELQSNIKHVAYGNLAQPNERSSSALIELVPFNEREVKSPELIRRLEKSIAEKIDPTISVRVLQFDAGPPQEEFPFKIQIYTDDTAKATKVAGELKSYLEGATVTRASGTTAQITKVKMPNDQIISRKDGRRLFEVQAAFNANDTSALLQAAESFTKSKFNDEFLAAQGLAENDVTYDFGQESQNADSFSSLGLIFPLALLLIYILLALQFRSFLQPILIFLAIPFSLFGVFAGLYATNNALSFFSMIGLIGLVGIAVNNSILLTDYANQERAEGHGPITAISHAVSKRFRPLVTTTLTTVFALVPLAITDPFWEPLALTIIFGLLSSTVLVVLSFPYYYLGFEWLRLHGLRRSR